MFIPTQVRMDDVSQEYKDFVDKFKPKKTTDDCYTPVEVYDAIADWVADEYKVDRADFVRPFFPGGDYERFLYTDASIVVDNPPFSILTQICSFYETHGVRYFLFAPFLTVLGIRPATCRVVTDLDIIYANGAKVITSFITNLDNALIRTAPELVRRVEAAQLAARKTDDKPKFIYPSEVLTSSAVGYIGRYGIDYRVEASDACFIRTMDEQRRIDKSIFGGGYLLSKDAAAARVAAEKAAARVAADQDRLIKVSGNTYIFELSDRERELQAQLGHKKEQNETHKTSAHDEYCGSCAAHPGD